MAARGEGQWLTAAAWATAAVLQNGLGHYEQALAAAEQASEDPAELGLATWSLVELIEAVGPDRTAGARGRSDQRLGEGHRCLPGLDWALGLQARSRALLSLDDGTAEGLYLEAIERLGRTRLRGELACAHLLYGERLRRQNRRMDARERLRVAYQMLTAMGAGGFAERARHELETTGENVRKRTIEKADGLTAQETQIAAPSGHGHTNPEISTPSCSSARGRSSGTCVRCSSSWASPRAGNSAGRCPAWNERPCRPRRKKEHGHRIGSARDGGSLSRRRVRAGWPW